MATINEFVLKIHQSTCVKAVARKSQQSQAAATVGVEESKGDDQDQRGMFDRVPQDVFTHFMCPFLNGQSLARLARVSKTLNRDAKEIADSRLLILKDEINELTNERGNAPELAWAKIPEGPFKNPIHQLIVLTTFKVTHPNAISALEVELNKLIEEYNKDPEIAGVKIPEGPFKNPIHQLRVLTACKDTLPNALEVLRSKGITDINARNEDGKPPLHLAAERSHTDVVNALIIAGADVNLVNNCGNTPLHVATLFGRTEIVQALIAAGAGVNERISGCCSISPNGDTLLEKAIMNGHTEIAKALIAAGADKDAKDNHGNTPLYNAAWNDCTDIVKALIDAGADVNAQNQYGYNPLHVATWFGCTESVEILNAVNTMFASCKSGDSDLFSEFQRQFNFVNFKVDGKTPLHRAVKYGHTHIVKQLIKLGADVSATDKHGMTPLELLKKLKSRNNLFCKRRFRRNVYQEIHNLLSNAAVVVPLVLAQRV